VSTDEAGLWQATLNINSYVVNIAIGSFSIYLLPKLSSITDRVKLKSELINIYKIIIPISLVGFWSIYLLREYIVLLLYSKEFLKVGHYLPLQMLGSFFWMCKVPLMNYMLAKEHTNVYIVNELVFAAMYILMAMLLIPKFQVQGIQMAFASYNFIYLITNIFIVKRYLRG
jgi:PST family polysaccharide transporter